MRRDRKSGSAGMPRPISYAVFCLKKKNNAAGAWPTLSWADGHAAAAAAAGVAKAGAVAWWCGSSSAPPISLLIALRTRTITFGRLSLFLDRTAASGIYPLSLHDALPISLRSSRSSYFATFRHQLTILSKTDALDEEKWLNMLGTFVKDWFRYESHFVHGRDSLVDILKERGLLSESDAVQPLIGKKS